MLIYLHGADSFLAKEAIGLLKQKYLEKNPTGTELIEIDPSTGSGQASADQLPNFADLKTIPMFATSRLIIIKRAGELAAADQDNLASMLTDLPASSVVVIWDAKPLKPKSALSDISDKATKKISAEPLVGAKLTGWIKARATALGLTIAPEATTDLVRQYGSNLWAIETDLLTRQTGAASSAWGQPLADKPFILFDDVRARRWPELKRHLINAFDRGEALELTIGGLAAAIRQSINDENLRRQLVSQLSELDLALKTGLIEAGDAVALLVAHLPDGQNRVQWEELCQTLS